MVPLVRSNWIIHVSVMFGSIFLLGKIFYLLTIFKGLFLDMMMLVSLVDDYG